MLLQATPTSPTADDATDTGPWLISHPLRYLDRVVGIMGQTPLYVSLIPMNENDSLNQQARLEVTVRLANQMHPPLTLTHQAQTVGADPIRHSVTRERLLLSMTDVRWRGRPRSKWTPSPRFSSTEPGKPRRISCRRSI